MSVRDWDWSMPRGHTTALGYASETAASMVMLAPLTGLPWQAAAITLGSAAAAGVAYDLRQGTTTGTVATRAASWLTSAGWASWALATAPLDAIGWAIGLGTWALGAGLNVSATRSEPTRRERRDGLKLRRKSVGVLREWEDRLARVARIEGCHGVDIQWWAENVGYTVEMRLPSGGTTIDEVAGLGKRFAADLRLPDGCGVEIRQGADRGTVLIDVTVRDVVSEERYFPEDFSELSLTERFPFGLHRNGDPALGELCNDCGVLIGETDSGKTNTLNTINAQLARMPDALIWHIDITGAGIALPWITPWATEGIASAPIVDWVAHTPDEARLMLRMASEIIAARKAGYQQLMRSKNTDKLPISHEIPGIVIVADEVASLPHDIKESLDKVTNEGRAVRVRELACGLRATQDVITAAMKLQAKWRVGMTVTDPEEIAYLFPGYIKIDTNDAPVAGSGWTMHSRLGPRQPAPFKGWRITPGIIDKICRACAARRPSLDQLSLDVPTGAHYHQRWARCLPVLYKGQQLTDAAQQAVDAGADGKDAASILAASPAPADQPAAYGSGTEAPAGGAAAMFAAIDARLTPPAGRADQAGVDLAKTPEAAAGLPRPQPVTDPRELAWQILEAAADAGYTPKELHAALAQALTERGEDARIPAPRTVSGWLARWAEQGRAAADTSGQYTRYTATTAAAAPAGRGLPQGIDAALVVQAAQLVAATQFGSPSMLQRKLRVNVAVASQLMDTLQQHGIVGPLNDGQARDVLVPADDGQALTRLAQELGLTPQDPALAGTASNDKE